MKRGKGPRTIVVGRTLYRVPVYVVRKHVNGQQGWIARPPGAAHAYFGDWTYGGTRPALREAIRYRERHYSAPEQVRRTPQLQTREWRTKANPTGVPGVFWYLDPGRAGRAGRIVVVAQAGARLIRRRSVPAADFDRQKRRLLAWARAERKRLRAVYETARA